MTEKPSESQDAPPRYKKQNEKRRRLRALARHRRYAEEARQALAVYAVTGSMEETARQINLSAAVVSKRVKLARQLAKAGKIVVRCEISAP